MDRSTPGLPVHNGLLEFTQTHLHWVGDVIQPSHTLSSPSPLAFNLSQHHGLFKWVSSSWPKYWSLSFSISPSNEYSGLISFRMDWLDLLAVQGTLKSLLQHHSYLLGNQWTWQAWSRLVVIEMGREGSCVTWWDVTASMGWVGEGPRPSLVTSQLEPGSQKKLESSRERGSVAKGAGFGKPVSREQF